MKPSWKHRTVLITCGPTREHLDPIRFLTNASSGRMGFALAAEARSRGASVIVVRGPSSEPPPSGVTVVPVVTGLEMYRETLSRSARAHVVIGAAAVSDWRFKTVARHKIKRSSAAPRLTLTPNPDIIKEVARRRSGGQIVVGFALETRRQHAAGRGKLESKGLDLIVTNGPGSLSGDRTRASILTREGGTEVLPALTKRRLAKRIFAAIERQWRKAN